VLDWPQLGLCLATAFGLGVYLGRKTGEPCDGVRRDACPAVRLLQSEIKHLMRVIERLRPHVPPSAWWKAWHKQETDS